MRRSLKTTAALRDSRSPELLVFIFQTVEYVCGLLYGVLCRSSKNIVYMTPAKTAPNVACARLTNGMLPIHSTIGIKSTGISSGVS